MMDASSFPATHRLAHIERLVDAIDLPIGRWNRDNRLVFCNTPYLHWAGRSREEPLHAADWTRRNRGMQAFPFEAAGAPFPHMSRARVLIYSHDTFGLGHLAR